MKLRTVGTAALSRAQRLDSYYFLSPGVRSVDRLACASRQGYRSAPLGGPHGLGRVWQPQRFKRVYAASGEKRVPYLRPYDVFDYLPRAADYLSEGRTKHLGIHLAKAGTILQTRSGRNLGPAVAVDEYVEGFALSDDMIRIEIQDERLRYYTLAFLQSATGQNLVRRDKSGSVIDHVSDKHIAGVHVPMLREEIRNAAAEHMGDAVRLRGRARIELGDLIASLEEVLPSPGPSAKLAEGWTVRRSALDGRLDAAPQCPQVRNVRKYLLENGGVYVRDLATVLKPRGRYKTVYVDADHGRPILSGGQLLQHRPVNLRYMAPRAFSRVADYELEAGWLAYPADGRAEESLGTPVLVNSSRAGWLASGHVGRVIPKAGVDAGWLYLALSTWQAQVQLKAVASGSVVDSTFEWDMAGVVIPAPRALKRNDVVEVWEKFAQAEVSEAAAIELVEQELDRLEIEAGRTTPPLQS